MDHHVQDPVTEDVREHATAAVVINAHQIVRAAVILHALVIVYLAAQIPAQIPQQEQ